MEGQPIHSNRSSATPLVPLVVDVDGTLVGGDLLFEGAARLLAASPLELLGLVLLANRGVVDDDPVVFTLRDRTSRTA